MSTVAAAKPAIHAPTLAQRDRVFYSSMAIVMLLTIVAGFAPTYFLKFFGDAPMTTISGRPFTSTVHLHGALFTAWIALFLVQTALVATHRVAVHRKLGILGAVLAGMMLVAGTATAIQSAQRGTSVPGIDPLSFLAIPLGDMLMFGTFVTLAVAMRRKKEAHKRLMLLAYISIATAAVARLPRILPLGPLVFFGLTFLFLLAGIAYDFLSRRKVHPAYIWGGGALVLSVPLRLVISNTEAWKSFARVLVS